MYPQNYFVLNYFVLSFAPQYSQFWRRSNPDFKFSLSGNGVKPMSCRERIFGLDLLERLCNEEERFMRNLLLSSKRFRNEEVRTICSCWKQRISSTRIGEWRSLMQRYRNFFSIFFQKWDALLQFSRYLCIHLIHVILEDFIYEKKSSFISLEAFT
jgi:hypothetical protein